MLLLKTVRRGTLTVYFNHVKGKKNVNYFSSSPEFSAVKYGTKKKQFNVVSDDHLKFFRNLLGPNRILTDQDDVLSHNIDFTKNCRGQSNIVLKPKTTQEISALLAFCNNNNLAVCPQGGNSGISGGSVPVFDEIIINTSLMNKIIKIDEKSGVLVCEAGCILENLDEALKKYKLMMPLDLGAKGICHIGGNVSTNAGGLRVLRYGSLHGTVLGLEAVKANGDIIDCLNTHKKDNTGYHLKNLFIGSEGTLGIVTKVAISCPVLPNAVNLAVLGFENYEAALTTFLRAKKGLGEILSAFEIMDKASMDVSVKTMNVQNPVGDFPLYVFVETNGSNQEHDSEKLFTLLNDEMTAGTVSNGVVVTEESKLKKIWALRELIASAVMSKGYTLNYDLSLELDHFYELVEIMKKHLETEPVVVYGYGHMGDRNIHIQILMDDYSEDIIKKVEPYIYDVTANFNGSISAEHGIGYKKTQYLHLCKNDATINLMRDLKNTMDPKGILNPYKVLPEQFACASSQLGFYTGVIILVTMPAYFAFIILIAILGVRTEEFPTQEFIDLLKPVADKCMAESGVERDIVVHFSEGRMPDDPKLKKKAKIKKKAISLFNLMYRSSPENNKDKFC